MKKPDPRDIFAAFFFGGMGLLSMVLFARAVDLSHPLGPGGGHRWTVTTSCYVANQDADQDGYCASPPFQIFHNDQNTMISAARPTGTILDGGRARGAGVMNGE